MKDLSRIKTGKRGEEIAIRHLETLGYRIMERNYRCPLGEIDIVARDGDAIVFVEVKSRRTELFGDPELAVGKAKQKKLSLLALYYLTQKHYPLVDARFDVVAVKMLPDRTEIRLIRNAFELAWD
ncbi:MAG: YraN family protein [Syntrophales bacterium LBB04]|nr:YraN family protein [Syntrophales bacterium LBB04]